MSAVYVISLCFLGLSIVTMFILLIPRKEKRDSGDAEFFVKRGDYLTAGIIYENKGEYLKALDMYEKAGAYGLVARLSERKGIREKEASARSALGEHLVAGGLYEQLQRFEDALIEYTKGGYSRKIMEIMKRKGVDYIPENDVSEKSFDAYYKKGNISKAREIASNYFKSRLELLPQDIRTSDPVLRRIAIFLGECYEREGIYGEAGRFYAIGGEILKAASLLEVAGEKEKAAELYYKDGEYESAKRLYQELGQEENVKRCEMQMLIKEGKFNDAGTIAELLGELQLAVNLYKRAGNYLKAGEVLLRIGEFGDAGDLFMKAGNVRKAAEAYEKAGNFKRAAELYKEMGERSREMECLIKDGDYFGAGVVAFEMGKLDKAMEYFQKVEIDSPAYKDASLYLGMLFAEKGLYTQAIERLGDILKNERCSKDNIRAFYSYGVSLQSLGNVREALTVFEKVLSVDVNYRDVPQRVAELKQMLTPTSRKRYEELTETQRITPPKAPRPEREDKFEIIEKVGRGGMGIVFKARDTILDRIVALKILSPELSHNAEAVQRFLKEAKACASLNHPHIVTIYEAGMMKDTLYISMEFIDGPTVKKLIEEYGQLPIKHVIFITAQVCKGLEYAHSRGIIHRDIKPSNIMINDKKVVKILDFGLAKIMEEVRREYTVASGTPYYMSPEQTLGEKVDHRTDIYSLGITMYEMIAGRPPFTGGDVGYHHVHTPPPPLREFRSDVPPSLEAIVMKCLEKDRDRRFQSAKELFIAMREVAESIK